MNKYTYIWKIVRCPRCGVKLKNNCDCKADTRYLIPKIRVYCRNCGCILEM